MLEAHDLKTVARTVVPAMLDLLLTKNGSGIAKKDLVSWGISPARFKRLRKKYDIDTDVINTLIDEVLKEERIQVVEYDEVSSTVIYHQQFAKAVDELREMFVYAINGEVQEYEGIPVRTDPSTKQKSVWLTKEEIITTWNLALAEGPKTSGGLRDAFRAMGAVGDNVQLMPMVQQAVRYSNSQSGAGDLMPVKHRREGLLYVLVENDPDPIEALVAQVSGGIVVVRKVYPDITLLNIKGRGMRRAIPVALQPQETAIVQLVTDLTAFGDADVRVDRIENLELVGESTNYQLSEFGADAIVLLTIGEGEPDQPTWVEVVTIYHNVTQINLRSKRNTQIALEEGEEADVALVPQALNYIAEYDISSGNAEAVELIMSNGDSLDLKPFTPMKVYILYKEQ